MGRGQAHLLEFEHQPCAGFNSAGLALPLFPLLLRLGCPTAATLAPFSSEKVLQERGLVHVLDVTIGVSDLHVFARFHSPPSKQRQ